MSKTSIILGSNVLGTTKIKTWYFLTPRYDNKNLLAHCVKKALEVNSKNCSHIDNNFCILIATEDDFIQERQILVSAGTTQIAYAVPSIVNTQIQNWQQSQSSMVQTLTNKISNIGNVKDVNKYVDLNIRQFLIGQHILNRMHKEYPEHYERILRIKIAQESKVERLSLVPINTPGDMLKECLEEYEQLLSQALNNSVEYSLCMTLAQEAISDWLIRCPLDF